MKKLEDARSEYVTVQEVAQRYRLSNAKAYELAHSLEHTLVLGRAIRVFEPDLRALEGRNGEKGVNGG